MLTHISRDILAVRPDKASIWKDHLQEYYTRNPLWVTHNGNGFISGQLGVRKALSVTTTAYPVHDNSAIWRHCQLGCPQESLKYRLLQSEQVQNNKETQRLKKSVSLTFLKN